VFYEDAEIMHVILNMGRQISCSHYRQPQSKLFPGFSNSTYNGN